MKFRRIFLLSALCTLLIPSMALAEGLTINKENNSVSVTAFVNYRYLRKPNLCAVVNRGGYNAKRSLFISEATPADLFNALTELGIKPGDNLSPETPPGTKTEGDKVRVYVTWEGLGRTYRLSDIVRSDDLSRFDFRFSGNRENMVTVPTGYLLTLESNPFSIVGNAKLGVLPYGRRERAFRVKKGILPENGTDVKIIFKVAN